MPKIYAYEDRDPRHKGLLKIGYTERDARSRIKEQYPVIRPDEEPYRIVVEEDAIKADGSYFTDKDVHKVLRARAIPNPRGEWFRCEPNQVLAAIRFLRSDIETVELREHSFSMRPEQAKAVSITAAYFRSFQGSKQRPHFLWNAKMRFGKTFASYQLARELAWTKVLILSFKPAVQNAWEADLCEHADFAGWQFVSRGGIAAQNVDSSRPIVCFGSFQDYLGRTKSGEVKSKNQWVHDTEWDCVILDEYHYGAWRESAKELFEGEPNENETTMFGDGLVHFEEREFPIRTNAFLYLSGTPFRALQSGEFTEDQIFNWTYSDEQKAKHSWIGDNNPYSSLPRMFLMTYELPDEVRKIATDEENDEFDLNTFFATSGTGGQAKFIYVDQVQRWLDFIRGASPDQIGLTHQKTTTKARFPFGDRTLLAALAHTFWFLPNVAACHAMSNLIREPQNSFFSDYKIIVAAGPAAGLGAKALSPVLNAMDDPIKTKSITLSCGKLTTGVSVAPWTGIFMLKNLSSPETYFQAAFRVQTPWTIRNADGLSPNSVSVVKHDCYVFDFAPNRALEQIARYSSRLGAENVSPENKVDEFIKFLPVLAYDGTEMRPLDAAQVLDIALQGTSATLLAKRWESALLVNVDIATLERLLASGPAMDALQKIEGFRALGEDISMVINKTDEIKKISKARDLDGISKSNKKDIDDRKKEIKNLKKNIQEKLIKFLTRIPVFMYLSDHREETLYDVITKLEPSLFKKVTGLEIHDFKLLISLNIFNDRLMDDAIYKFKRYEDESLNYLIPQNEFSKKVGLFR